MPSIYTLSQKVTAGCAAAKQENQGKEKAWASNRRSSTAEQQRDFEERWLRQARLKQKNGKSTERKSPRKEREKKQIQPSEKYNSEIGSQPKIAQPKEKGSVGEGSN